MSAPGLTIVIVAYHCEDDLEGCLRDLGPTWSVIVVDNSSLPAVRRIVHRYGAEYIDPGRNLGFAAGVNLGIQRAASSHDILLLNPDARVAPDAVAALHSRLAAETLRRAAAVSPTLTGLDGKPERVGWPWPTPTGIWIEAMGLGRLRRRTDFLIGAVLLLRRSALDEIGPFDERFFLYAEEADWQRRATQAGWEVILCEEIEAQHRGAGASTDELQRERLFHAAGERYIRKWYGSAGWQVYRAGALVGSAVRSVILPPNRRSPAWRRFRLYLHGPVAALESKRWVP